MSISAAAASAQQRPLVTEDPETVGSGNVLVEGGFDYQWDVFYPVSGLTGDLLRVPTLGVSFGISSIAELQIDGGFYNRLDVTSRQPAPLSGELAFKAARARIAVVATPSIPSTIAVDIAKAAGMALVGRAVSGRPQIHG